MLAYNGKLRDRVSPGSLGLGGNGALDGTFTVTLHALGGRPIILWHPPEPVRTSGHT